MSFLEQFAGECKQRSWNSGIAQDMPYLEE